jgi:hypothetical protein
LSRHEPLTDVFGLSGPAYVACVQDAICEVASVPLKATVSGVLYQPFASGGRAGTAVTVGGVASRCMCTVEDALPSLHTAVHVMSVLTVSVTIVCASQPSVVRYPSGWTTQLTVTLVTYQPFAPCVP